MVGRCPSWSDCVGRGRTLSDSVGLNCCVSSLITPVYTSCRKNKRKISTTSEVQKCGTMKGMEHISDALKERNIILETTDPVVARSEEHTSELQSRQYLVCRLLLE